MDFFSLPNTKMDATFIICVVGILLAVVSYALSRRTEKLEGIPVMTGYGDDHEKAMLDGTMKVGSVTDIS
jgi:hypothetical protein